MPVVRMTKTQAGVSHILADFFRDHAEQHGLAIAESKECRYCQALDDLEEYIKVTAESNAT